jgi:LysM repeat protein
MMPGGFMKRSKITRVALAALAGVVAAGTTHIVVKGDTLWDISGHYLGNPFQWPSVWKLNPQVKNAHWIYPGDTINLDVSSDSGKAKPSAEVSAHENEGRNGDPLAGFDKGLDAAQPAVIDSNTNAIDLIVPATHSFLNDEILLMAPVLRPTSDSAKSAFQGKVQWDPQTGHQEVLIGALLKTDVGGDKGLKVGERVQIVESGDQVATEVVADLKGRLEQVRGIALIVEVHPKWALLRTEKVFGRITTGSVVRPLDLPKATQVTKFKAVREDTSERVVVNTRAGRTQLPGSYAVVARGESSGVQLGDIFEFMDASQERGLLAMRGYGLVVRTTASTSTVLLVGTTPKPIVPGDKAWRIRAASHG